MSEEVLLLPAEPLLVTSCVTHLGVSDCLSDWCFRNRMHLGPQQALYLLVNNRSMASLSRTLAEVYQEHQDEDGFLYITYASQEVFGSA